MCFTLAALSYKFAFGNRADKNPLLKYFTAEDFNLKTRLVSVKSGKTVLNGYVYTSITAPAVTPSASVVSAVSGNPSAPLSHFERAQRVEKSSPQNLVIFAHGMGAGQIAYTTEIAYLCNRGAAVLALDSTGCNLSQGKGIKGMYEGAKTVLAAIDYAKSDPQLKDLKITLIGHSWGGYSVVCAAAQRKVEKVIAISAPATPAKTLKGGAARVIGKPLAAILSPFWRVINFFKFGKRGNANAAKCAETAAENGTQVILIHGDKDEIVAPENAVFYKAQSEKITKHLAKGKAHNPYNTVAAEQKLKELTKMLSSKASAEEKEKFFADFDFRAATEEDEEIMKILM